MEFTEWLHPVYKNVSHKIIDHEKVNGCNKDKLPDFDQLCDVSRTINHYQWESN